MKTIGKCLRMPMNNPSKSKLWWVSGLLLLTVALGGCRENGATKLSDAELIAEREDCLRTQNPGPAMIMACDNYARECKRRGKKTGNYIC